METAHAARSVSSAFLMLSISYVELHAATGDKLAQDLASWALEAANNWEQRAEMVALIAGEPV